MRPSERPDAHVSAGTIYGRCLAYMCSQGPVFNAMLESLQNQGEGTCLCSGLLVVRKR